MIGLEFLTFKNAGTAHSALRYYFEIDWVRPVHYLAILLNTAIILLTGIGIFLTRRRVRVEPVISMMAMAGFFLAWGEIFAALQVKSTLFRLTELPYQPVNNTGIIGAQAFAMYIIFKLPSGHLEAWKGFFIRLGLAIGAFLAQLLAFQLLAGSV